MSQQENAKSHNGDPSLSSNATGILQYKRGSQLPPANLTKAVRETSGSSFFKKKFQNKFNFFEVTSGRNQLTASIRQGVTGSKQQLLLSEVSHMQIHPVIE